MSQQGSRLVDIPAAFAQNMRDVYGAAGDAWLATLPAIVERCATRWELAIGERFEPLSYNFVVAVTLADRSGGVLKVGYPCPELANERAALAAYGGEGMVRLLASDEGQGAMLLERIEPGMTLEPATDDVAATAIAAGVMRHLRKPPGAHPFPSVADWAAGFRRLRAAFGGTTGPFDAAVVSEAEELFQTLLETSAQPVLLHGDLHHANILLGHDGEWLAIDPKGVTGEPQYEVGAFVRNPAGLYDSVKTPEKVVARRLSQFSEELGFDRERLRAWGVAQAVLSSWWTWEDHGEVGERALRCAAWLRSA